MKILHLTTSGDEASDTSGFRSSISSLDLKSASAVMIDVVAEKSSALGDERLQRQRDELAAASVSSLSVVSADGRYRDVAPSALSGNRYPTLARRIEACSRRGRPRAASLLPPTPGHRGFSGSATDDGCGDAAEATTRGAGRDASTTRCPTSSITAADTAAAGRVPPSTVGDTSAAADANELSRDLRDHRYVGLPPSRQLTRRCPEVRPVAADVTQQCRCRSTSGLAAGDRKFRLYRKHFVADDADDCNSSRSVVTSCISASLRNRQELCPKCFLTSASADVIQWSESDTVGCVTGRASSMQKISHRYSPKILCKAFSDPSSPG